MQVMNRVGREYLLQMVAFAIAILDRLIVPAILLRSLGVGGFSGWTVAFAFAGFVPVLDFGVTRYFTNRLLMLCATDGTAEAHRVFRQATILLLLLSAIATAGFAAAVVWFPPQSGDASIDADMLAVVLPILLAVFLQQTIAIRQGLYRAHSHFAREISLRAVSDTARIVTVAALAASGIGLIMLAWTWLLAIVVLQVLPFIIDSYRRYPGFREGRVDFTRSEIGEVVATSPGYWLQALLTTAFASVPIVVLGYWAIAPVAVAQFGLMRTIANLVRQVLQMFANVFGLELARRVALDDRAGFASVFFETCRFTAAQSAVAAVSLLFLGRELFALWTAQPQLYDSLMLILAIAPPILLPSMIASTEAIAYAGRPWLIVQARFAQFVLSIILVAVLPIADTAMRMMAALAIGEVLAFGVPLALSMRSINPAVGWSMQLRLIGVVALSAGTALLFLSPLWAMAGWPPMARLAIGSVLGALAMAAALWLWGIDHQRRTAIVVPLQSRIRRPRRG